MRARFCTVNILIAYRTHPPNSVRQLPRGYRYTRRAFDEGTEDEWDCAYRVATRPPRSCQWGVVSLRSPDAVRISMRWEKHQDLLCWSQSAARGYPSPGRYSLSERDSLMVQLAQASATGGANGNLNGGNPARAPALRTAALVGRRVNADTGRREATGNAERSTCCQQGEQGGRFTETGCGFFSSNVSSPYLSDLATLSGICDFVFEFFEAIKNSSAVIDEFFKHGSAAVWQLTTLSFISTQYIQHGRLLWIDYKQGNQTRTTCYVIRIWHLLFDQAS
ncbi:uncharacterized protein BO95DRAFT_431196 [Aspergillus brunneoviolaceus CBS 621.78]|uniref:Uncharacterized protein n=1 Tax=Aspergillus brunneoviolaceus CBS 621.78 TaxID=1450534 RepID=A0ACD1GBU3_9EURO|nr:hypothetical protein BO95DRAFT_431196 [Aspergillus brunneoviolaceus CBS 621.78]RAH46591.1 hypothetical protein BO95DRAFT_431196 [Aspergillus brunneoviolaceus CBS 621.78]